VAAHEQASGGQRRDGTDIKACPKDAFYCCYGETRHITVGFLGDRMVVLAWTPRNGARRIISMRKANDREQKAYAPRF
jgi:uncharacterized DUF497 family protein